MTTDADAWPVAEYGQWLEDRITAYVKLARNIVEHDGEKGRIGEAVVAAALREFLPQRFSLGTGFIINGAGRRSWQQDIVIYDHWHNAPIMVEGGVGIFPIECVYATVEVKLSIDRPSFVKTLESIAKIRRLSNEAAQYTEYGTVEGRHGGPVVDIKTARRGTPPRAFIFAIDASGLAPQEITAILRHEVPDAFLHGVLFLKRPWYAAQVAYDKLRTLEPADSENAFAAFLIGLRHDVQSIGMRPGHIDPYIRRSGKSGELDM